ncbi:MAG: MBL fold metallo-hydrolase [Saprospiraceae bacterium]|nr:MBL fold metallo-hydrolase [Saprospiraceae bacterium]
MKTSPDGKSTSLFIIIILHLSFSAFAQEIKLIDEIRDHNHGTGLWWVGHNGWIIKSGDLVISTDILLEYGERINPPRISAEELATVLDISFVTHGHNDHFNRAVSKILLEKSNCIFVLPGSCLQIAEELGIPDNRLQIAKPREPFEIMGISVNPVRAIHGNANFAIYYDANLQDCGYQINVDGTTFLQPGDSYLLEDHLFLKHVDVLFFSPTEHNMYIDRSVILINALNPDYIFPQHHGTIQVTDQSRFWAKGYPDEVKIRLSQELKEKYHILGEGDKMIIK